MTGSSPLKSSLNISGHFIEIFLASRLPPLIDFYVQVKYCQEMKVHGKN